MAYTTIVFENPRTGQIKEAPVGFSWTVLFFSFFPPLFRGDWKWAVIMFLLAILTFSLSTLVFMFLYNRFYIKDLIDAGFKAKSVSIGTIGSVSREMGMSIPRLNEKQMTSEQQRLAAEAWKRMQGTN